MIQKLLESITRKSAQWAENLELALANAEHPLRLEKLRFQDGRTIKDAIKIIARSKLADSGCLEWTSAKKGKGYGSWFFRGKTVAVHRLVYRLWVSEITNNLFVLHKCDNRLCCNPNHLFLGTHMDNVRDAQSKNRLFKCKGELNPFHKLTDKQVAKIRSRYKFRDRKRNIYALARYYNVSPSTIHLIVRMRTWTHVNGQS